MGGDRLRDVEYDNKLFDAFKKYIDTFIERLEERIPQGKMFYIPSLWQSRRTKSRIQNIGHHMVGNRYDLLNSPYINCTRK